MYIKDYYFKFKKVFFLLFFLFCFFNLFLLLISKLRRKINDNECDYGEDLIQGKCIKPSFDLIPEATIDDDGIFKYIQIKCDNNYLFVRGRKDCQYHKYIFAKFLDEVENNHLDKKLCKAIGGGRIKNNKLKKTIKIYGYSKSFGRAINQHETTKQILQKYYPNYDITFSNEGY